MIITPRFGINVIIIVNMLYNSVIIKLHCNKLGNLRFFYQKLTYLSFQLIIIVHFAPFQFHLGSFGKFFFVSKSCHFYIFLRKFSIKFVKNCCNLYTYKCIHCKVKIFKSYFYIKT